ncbi:MAG: UDP-2,3-diacylglucosamine diphosphatase [Odoribacter sp.]|nr:UDP-2,3-diacylglucosamine diphosphatase [Odoribacter sp.]
MKNRIINKSIYFLSDAHLGASVLSDNPEREKKLVKWLDSIADDCSILFLLGDIFDFWFEYRKVVPKGFIRFLGKICELTDKGIEVHFFIGNHDMWVSDYLSKECGIIIHYQDEKFSFNGKKFYIGHGDDLDPKDKSYLFLKKVFRNRILQKCFRFIHPDWGIALAHKWSSHSRLKNINKTEATTYKGDEEDIEQYSRQILKEEHFDYFIFGHRHLPLDIALSENSRYINTGDWITFYTYAVFDGKDIYLKMQTIFESKLK